MSDLAALNKSVSLSSAAQDFNFIAKCLLATRGNHHEMQKWAYEFAPSSRARDVIKAGILAQSLSTSGALAPYAGLADGFFGSLGALSAFSKIYNAGDFLRTPLRTQCAVLTTAPVGHPVSELGAKPLSSANFAQTTLEANKVTSFIVVTNELARSISQAAVLRLGAELRRAASIAVDSKFLALMAATSGITTAATTGTTTAQVLADLTAALIRLTVGADSKLWLVCSPKLAKTLSLLQGTGGYLVQNGAIGPISLAPSDAATTVATLLDARQIAAELDSVTLDRANEGALQLDDAPTSSPQPMVNLWQENLTGLKCEIRFGAVATRSTSVTTLTGYAA
jgi:hypothetical protein